ncbi:tyrosine-type recombinase/integrase [Nostocoides sp. F2B08]|uniref:tyrosine-type recombinase/integrase n=1 Tax=Nostocoides sp. F2B08 TaxID=2653936 RepID=UPI00126384E3|nr:site-specific integrase [Tetrasphaera sp. F2B08]KAB7744502.1 tyrosine-type recombinase/integrase [Tetrasphaera sp. F2B08]
MAWIEERKRADGGTSAHVRWRLGGVRSGQVQIETFSAGSDAQNRARAAGFKQMVDAAGQYWPEGWVKGEGFVRPREDNRYEATPSFAAIGEEYVRQIVELSPGQRKRYLSQIWTLAEVEVRGERIFERAIDAITERDIKAWLIDWDRALKTKANYHGLLFGVFTYAVEEGYLSTNPCARTAPKRSRVRQSQAELRFLTEDELSTAVRLAGENGDLLTFAVGTGLRFGEVTALWCSDIDLTHGTVRVNKAWKRDGENGAGETPGWLRKQLGPKHTMRQHHLGNPKTPKSRRTVSISPALVELLKPHVHRRAADDFVFASPTGLPLHNSDFYERVWIPLGRAMQKEGIASFRFHDLRHTHVAWLIAGGAPLPHIQARLGHESITTTIDTYGHLLPVGDELISQIIDTALRGGRIRPAMHLLKS